MPKVIKYQKNSCHNSDIEQFFLYQLPYKPAVFMKGGEL